jgi:hypothetical protein
MMKTAKLVKKALKQPELYSEGELMYFHLWMNERKKRKERKRQLKRLLLEKQYLESSGGV